VLVDFHSHSFASDGTLSPGELAAAMRSRNVEIFSITDHDTTDAYGALEGGVAPASLVTGVEINTTYRTSEVHILGYGFELGAEPLAGLLAENRTRRRHRIEEMLAALRAGGHEISLDDVETEAGGHNRALGRPHVAKALVRAGYASGIEAAFRDFLGRGRPAYVPQLYIRPHDAVRVIARAGGVPVLAHPGRIKDENIIAELVDAGLVGLEVFYPTHEPGQVAHFRRVAAQWGLVMTGGSDFHDVRWNARGVGMDVERADIEAFLELVR
jgi:predicted metal-dependent phosphoesterase TrpH